MGRFSEKSAVSVEVKLYGADGRLIDKIEKTR
jgi:predicted nucleic acid-binding protein